jgi:uncharacterized membrane protein
MKTVLSFGGVRLTGSALITLLILLTVIVFVASYYLFDNTPQTTLRFIGGLFYLLYLPGFVLCWAMFPDSNEIDSIERLGLNFGLSIPLTLVTVLAADKVFKVPVTSLNIILSIGVVMFVLIIVGVVFRRLKKKKQNNVPNTVS